MNKSRSDDAFNVDYRLVEGKRPLVHSDKPTFLNNVDAHLFIHDDILNVASALFDKVKSSLRTADYREHALKVMVEAGAPCSSVTDTQNAMLCALADTYGLKTKNNKLFKKAREAVSQRHQSTSILNRAMYAPSLTDVKDIAEQLRVVARAVDRLVQRFELSDHEVVRRGLVLREDIKRALNSNTGSTTRPKEKKRA